MSDETYNGWSNRETWAVALHINNDQGWQESVLEALRADEPLQGETWAGDRPSGFQSFRAGEVIRENVEQVLDPEGDLWGGGDAAYWVKHILPALTDIGSLWRVDWSELGAAFLADLAEG